MNTIKKLLTRGIEEIIEKNHLEKSLRSGKKLRIKFGIDPTSPDLHLGHLVPLRKLKQFQDLGHKIVLIIGDFTATIGDPSGRSQARPPLSEAAVKKNLKTYLYQAGKIIDIKKSEIFYNSRWFKKSPKLILQLLKAGSVQQVLHRADFKKRLEENKEITLLEILYPLLQGYDSIASKADVEIGGADQKFNLLMGRQIQHRFGLLEQDIITLPLLEGTDGVKKMSKSFGNYIALTVSTDSMFGLIMSLSDNLMPKYFETLTDIDLKKALTLVKKDPFKAKLLLAKTIVGDLHGQKTGDQSQKNFVAIFSKKESPKNIPTLSVARNSLPIIDLLLLAQISSKSEARRLIEQGGISVDGQIKKDFSETISIKDGSILKIGKHRFFKIKF